MLEDPNDRERPEPVFDPNDFEYQQERYQDPQWTEPEPQEEYYYG